MHIAIIGCGQLSRMMAFAGIPLGITFSFIADEKEDTRCVDGLGTIVRWLPGQPVDELYDALGKPDCMTAEKEQIDIELVKALNEFCPIHPNVRAFAICQDRHQEKQTLEKLGIPSSPFVYGQPASVSAEKITLPAVAKSCREGYDGKNQWVLRTAEDVAAFDNQVEGSDHIIEQFIPFDKEISQVSVRNADGEILHYPLAENQHVKGILSRSIVPAMNISSTIAAKAQNYMKKLMEETDYVGVMAMECFVVGEELLVNELAPRVHNSGHWSQNGSITSQFENHIRAIAGLALGSTENHSISGMVNLIGTDGPTQQHLTPNSSLHWYNKTVRPGRKLGHVNFVAEDYEKLLAAMEAFTDEANPLVLAS